MAFERICVQCEKNFKGERENRLYCSFKCYGDSRKGRKRPEHSAAMKVLMKGHKFLTQESKNKIGKSHLKKLPLSVWKKYIEIVKRKYISHTGYIQGVLGIPGSDPFYRMENALLEKGYFERFPPIKPLPFRFQKLSFLEFEDFKKDCKRLNKEEISKKYSLTYNSVSDIVSLLGLGPLKRKICRTETWIEKKIREFLESLEIDFEQEYSTSHDILDRTRSGRFVYRYDFRIKNILIECHGDYWHCNPEIYDAPISKDQEYSIIRDLKKKEHAKKNNFILLVFWEREIENNFLEVKTKILSELKKNFII